MFEFYKGRFNIYFAGEKICMMSKMFLGLGAKFLLDESLWGNKIWRIVVDIFVFLRAK